MRRNTVISDVFSRLHYMERRGSGLSRIIESYDDVEEKPKFLSDSLSFTVIFPNKSYYKDKKKILSCLYRFIKAIKDLFTHNLD